MSNRFDFSASLKSADSVLGTTEGNKRTESDLFSSQSDRNEKLISEVIDIPLVKIDDFKDHPFKILNDENMKGLKESIANYGVINPVIVRRKGSDRYELISGHRRKYACDLLGMKTIKASIRELDDDQATILMVDSNNQRTEILPSEKAFAYRMKLEALKHQGKKDETDEKRSNERLAGEVGESREQIRRYIRLTYLTKELLGLVDSGELRLRVAVEISYLEESYQDSVLEFINWYEKKPSIADVKRLRKRIDESEVHLENEEIMMILGNDQIPGQMSITDIELGEKIPAPEETVNNEKQLVLTEKIVNLIPDRISKDQYESYLCDAILNFEKFLEFKSKRSN